MFLSEDTGSPWSVPNRFLYRPMKDGDRCTFSRGPAIQKFGNGCRNPEVLCFFSRESPHSSSYSLPEIEWLTECAGHIQLLRKGRHSSRRRKNTLHSHHSDWWNGWFPSAEETACPSRLHIQRQSPLFCRELIFFKSIPVGKMVPDGSIRRHRLQQRSALFFHASSFGQFWVPSFWTSWPHISDNPNFMMWHSQILSNIHAFF